MSRDSSPAVPLPSDEVATDSDWLPLHYTARAGLLSELGRQTYDTLYKALREALLNGIDAGANELCLDFGSAEPDTLSVVDDGEGMSLEDVRQSFMSLGGSAKFSDGSKFGRIGIGSLALLTYAREARIESKKAGSPDLVEAELFHPGSLDKSERQRELGEFSAGVVTTHSYAGKKSDHFTRITLRGLLPELAQVCEDPTSFFDLLEKLRKVLPLPVGTSRLLDSLKKSEPELAELLDDHCATWSVPLRIKSVFQPDRFLTRRMFGEEADEMWSGRIVPIQKVIRRIRPGERREIKVLGFLVNQRKASPRWSGISARVQNVTVEEQTFFDVEADPGFRKYIAGEVFLLGDLDTDRLINIDRASFNRESGDYEVVQRFMCEQIEGFKKAHVSQPQRAKVTVRRVLESYARSLREIGNVMDHAESLIEMADLSSLPSSKNGSLSYAPTVDLKSLAASLVGRFAVVEEIGKKGFDLTEPEGSDGLVLSVSPSLMAPKLAVRGAEYSLVFKDGRATGPSVIVKNRPREIVFNLGHPAVGRDFVSGKAALALAIELAYVLPREDSAAAFQDRVLDFVAVIQ